MAGGSSMTMPATPEACRSARNMAVRRAVPERRFMILGDSDAMRRGRRSTIRRDFFMKAWMVRDFLSYEADQFSACPACRHSRGRMR